ncbi:MAG: NAD-dependent deacylase [Methylomonas sp.]|jgi:NAD-dependent deacetylase|uniref:SIR2 family NAD-dependent protein deacylase n=1 Tax=Methylomonas sp. TaxID=418 RepID=UPI0025FF80F8|nr:NAD-dependent deacylase [Methylomonas sp.]MCK9608669.1 NAD-dependent deacylase [Methylomonas sp.]
MISAKLIDLLKQAKHLVILTGAGVSAESGIPTFRDALTGLWENYDASQLACEEGFLADPALVWGWYEWRRHRVLNAQPNPAHTTIAKLAKRIPKLTLITQNVDDLHERAGSGDVLHLHGSLNHPRCIKCGAPYQHLEATPVGCESRIDPPNCSVCNGLVRPGVVWFGERLPAEQWDLSKEACKTCELMMIVGTSGMVWPAAELPYLAERLDVPIIQINPTDTSFNIIAKFNLCGKAGEILPKLYEEAFSDL